MFLLLVGRGTPVAIRAYDGSEAGPDDPVATIVVKSPTALQYIVTAPSDLGLARAFITGELDVEGDLHEALRALAARLKAPEMTDASAPQVTNLYRLANELTRTVVPPEAVFLRDDLDALKKGLDRRNQLLARRHDAHVALTNVVCGFAQVLGLTTAGDVSDAVRRPLYRFASELVKAHLPPAALVFHPAFDTLPVLLGDRAGLLRARDEALASLESRGFNRSLLARVPLDQLQDEALGAALTICNYSLPSVLAAKEAVNRAFEGGMSDGVMFERRLFHGLFGSADQKEGMAAFVEKRPGNWTGQ
jgi:hypothetical protein